MGFMQSKIDREFISKTASSVISEFSMSMNAEQKASQSLSFSGNVIGNNASVTIANVNMKQALGSLTAIANMSTQQISDINKSIADKVQTEVSRSSDMLGGMFKVSMDQESMKSMNEVVNNMSIKQAMECAIKNTLDQKIDVNGNTIMAGAKLEMYNINLEQTIKDSIMTCGFGNSQQQKTVDDTLRDISTKQSTSFELFSTGGYVTIGLIALVIVYINSKNGSGGND